MAALEIAELLGSVSVPLIVAFVCACVGEGWKSAKPKRIAARKVQSLIVPPLPLARELKVVPVRAASARTWIETPPVSWLGGEARLPGPIRYVTLFATSRIIGGLPIPLLQDSGWRRKIPPYSRAAATAFHRLPVRGVSGDCGRRRMKNGGGGEARDASFVGLLVEVCRAYGALTTKRNRGSCPGKDATITGPNRRF